MTCVCEMMGSFQSVCVCVCLLHKQPEAGALQMSAVCLGGSDFCLLSWLSPAPLLCVSLSFLSHLLLFICSSVHLSQSVWISSLPLPAVSTALPLNDDTAWPTHKKQTVQCGPHLHVLFLDFESIFQHAESFDSASLCHLESFRSS